MRIRTIKPEFWKSESVGRLSRDARLLFIGLWNHADDEGRFRASPALIKAELFPYDDIKPATILGWIKELSGNDAMIILWQGEDGNQYGCLPKFRDHQRIDKPQASKLPKPPANSTLPRTFQEHSKNDTGAFQVGLEGNGMEGNGTGKGMEGSGEGKSGSTGVEQVLTDFEVAWKAYPDKGGSKGKALEAYKKHRKAGDTQEQVLAGIERYKAYVTAKREAGQDLNWRNGQTFFNQHNWRDEWVTETLAPVHSNRTPIQPIGISRPVNDGMDAWKDQPR